MAFTFSTGLSAVCVFVGMLLKFPLDQCLNAKLCKSMLCQIQFIMEVLKLMDLAFGRLQIYAIWTFEQSSLVRPSTVLKAKM